MNRARAVMLALVGATACKAPGVIGILPSDAGSATDATDADGSSGTLPCPLASAAFCDTFDAPAAKGPRRGPLDGAAWEVARGTGGFNVGQSAFGTWLPIDLDVCGVPIPGALPPDDVQICGGRLVEGVNDGTGVATLAMSVTQPFDVAGRTGTIVFDVSNDTHGTHAAWPELWFTDQLVPTPSVHAPSWRAVPRNGFGLRFAGACDADRACLVCPGTSPKARVGMSSAVVVSGYAVKDSDAGDPLDVRLLDCVEPPPDQSHLNHFEVHVAVDLIEIYATDAGQTAPLKKIAVVDHPGLTFTRGFVTLLDAHNDGNYGGLGQGAHSFAWDNVAFDGPIVPRVRTYDVADASPTNLGWYAAANGATPPLRIAGVTPSSAGAGLLTFDFFIERPATTLLYTVNGNAHTAPWPFPAQETLTLRSIALPVDVSQLVAGENTLTLASDSASGITAINVGLVLDGAP